MGDELTIELPELGLSASVAGREPEIVTLAPRELKSGGDVHSVRSTVLIGPPDVARMQAREGEDRELADRRGDNDFWSVLMTLSFDPSEPETFASAWLRVNLDGDGEPVAFAMHPDRKEVPVGVEHSAGGELGYQGVKVSGSTKRSYDRQEAEVLAFNRGRTDPAWELKPSTGRALEGGQDLLLIVRAAKGSNGHGRVTFGAQIEWEEGGFLRRHRQEVTWKGDEATFEIGAGT